MKFETIQYAWWALWEWTTKKFLLLQWNNLNLAYSIWKKITQDRKAIPSSTPKKYNINSTFTTETPFVSFIIEIDNVEALDVLPEMLHALQNLSEPAWELLILINSSNHLILNDTRVIWINKSESMQVSPFSLCVRKARGEYLTWVPVNAAIAPTLISELRRQINKTPHADLVYFDEDVAGNRDPFFKPGWSPELLLSLNYVRGAFFHKSMLQKLISEHAELKISSEWDLVLCCLAYIRQAERIPHVLYHYHSGESPKVTDYEAVIRYLSRLGMDHPQVQLNEGYPRYTWKSHNHKLSVIIPTKNNLLLLQSCIKSVLTEETDLQLEIILIDTGSQDPAVFEFYRGLAGHPNISLYSEPAPFNYSRVNNIGVSHATGDLLLFLNNDVEAFERGWLMELVRCIELPNIGAVGPKLLYPDLSIQHAGIIIGMEGHCSHVFGSMQKDNPNPYGSTNWYRNYMAVTGACLMTSRTAFNAVGGFDEAYQLVFSDIEFCLRLGQHGYRILYSPFSKLIHHEGKSRGHVIPSEDICLGHEHFHKFVQVGDPYYHPHLSYSVRLPVFAWAFEETPTKRLQMIAQHAKSKVNTS